MTSAIICGMEHSGTTLVSDLLRQTGRYESGFEVGVLLGQGPRDFHKHEPFYGNMMAGWNITDGQLEYCCDTDCFAEFYNRLKSASELTQSADFIFDKTPRYVAELPSVAERSDAPIIVVYKDPRASVYSDFKRTGESDFKVWFENYAPKKLTYMRRCYEGYKYGNTLGDRVFSVSLEALCFDALRTAQKLFAHVQQKFKLEYLLMEQLRYKNTRAKYVSANVVLEYMHHLDATDCDLISRTFSEFEDWFFDT